MAPTALRAAELCGKCRFFKPPKQPFLALKEALLWNFQLFFSRSLTWWRLSIIVRKIAPSARTRLHPELLRKFKYEPTHFPDIIPLFTKLP